MIAPTEIELTLSRTQRRFVDDPLPFVLLLGGIGSGKSHAGAARALARRFGKTRPSLGLVISPTYKMLRDATWRTALQVWEPLLSRVVAHDTRVELQTGDEVLFRSADDPESLRGPNAAWAWLDEAALCHPMTWPIVIGRLRQHGELGEAWATTTPKGMNWVWQVWVEQATDQTAIHRTSTRANPFVDESFVAALRSQYGGDFARQELDAEFVADGEGTLIEWRWLEEAKGERSFEPDGGELVAGIDVAGPGEDETVVVVRQGPAILDVAAFLDADAKGPVLAHLRPWRHRGLTRVVVDSAGIGHYFGLDLGDEGYEVRPINVGVTASTDDARERYANLKAEYYWALRERFLDGDVRGLADRALLGQLAGLKYGHDRRGRVEIESKEKAQKRGIKSPDRAEALMLAFAPEDPAALRASLYGLRTAPSVAQVARPAGSLNPLNQRAFEVGR